MTDHRTQDAPRRWMTPYEVVRTVVGTDAVLADLLGLNRTTPIGWRFANSHRAAGDLPSARIQRALLDHCRAEGLPLCPEWLIEGAARAEVEGRMRAWRAAAAAAAAAAQPPAALPAPERAA